MSDGRTPFEVIEGGKGVKPRRKPNPRNTTKRTWECRTCAADIGVATRTLVQVAFGAQEDGQLRITGGRRAWACMTCLSRGKITYSDR